MIGHATSDRTCLPARDPAAAQALAEAVAGSSRSWRRPWRVRLEQLPLADPVAQLLAARLPGGAVVEGDACAVLDFDQGRDADTYERKSFRRNLRGGRNRLDRDGREWTIRRIDDPLAIEAALDDILALRRARDHNLGRRSDVDDLAGERRWRELVRAHASAGGAEVVELSVDGALGAYAIAFLDRGRYRLWDARIASDLRRYNLGHLVAQELLHSALVHEDIDELDLGRGAQEDKRMLASRLEERSDLVAASSAWARLILDAPGRLRWRAAQFKNRHPPLRRAWARVKQLTMSR
jgi:CelD/BcsL family acetyltransferase involved in cellulose biosynthesis